MKKICRTISIIVLTCFLANSLSFAVDTNSFISAQTTSEKLAVPSVCDDLVGIEHKDIGRIKFGLMMHLYYNLPRFSAGEILEDSDFERLGELRLTENTISSPAKMHFFFMERVVLPNGDISVMCRLEDKKYKPNVRTYHIVFSPERNKGGEFPIREVYTEKEYVRLKDLIEDEGKLPQRRLEKPEDAKAIERYIQHERVIDKWIRKKMQDADNYIKMNPHYTEAFLDLVFSENSSMQKLDLAFRGKLKDVLLASRDIILIKIKKGEKRPVIYEDGEEVEVGSHTSQNVIYAFVDEEFPDSSSLFEEIREYLDKGIIIEKDGTILDDKEMPFAYLPTKVHIESYITPSLIHEIGAMCGLDYEITKERKIINDLDRLYQEVDEVDKGWGMDLEKVVRMPLVKELDKKLSLVNLDYLRGAPDRLYERDYAFMIVGDNNMAGGANYGRGNTKIPIEEFEGHIAEIWKRAQDEIVFEPFSPKAQAAFQKMLDLLYSRYDEGAYFSLDTTYKLFYAKFFRDSDSRAIISYFESVESMIDPQEKALTLKALSEHRNFLTLYFTARLMDQRSVERAVEAEESFMMFYAKELFGNDTDPKSIFGSSLKDNINFGGKVTDNIFDFITSYMESGEYKKAQALVYNLVRHFRNELQLAQSETFKGMIEEELANLAETNDVIKAEMAASLAPQPAIILAKHVGVKIAPPVQNYTLVVDNNIYKDNELTDDKKGYLMPGIGHVGTADRFNIETADTSNVNNILKHVKEPKNTIVQVSGRLSHEDLKLLKVKAPDVRIMRVDTTYFKEDTEMTDEMRREARFGLYARMLLARRITREDILEKNNIYRLLSFYINVNHEDSDIADKYMEALVNSDFKGFTFIINTNLSYRPAERWRVKEYHLISAALISA